MQKFFFEPQQYQNFGKHAQKHNKIKSDDPIIAIAKMEVAVAKRLRKMERNKKLWS